MTSVAARREREWGYGSRAAGVRRVSDVTGDYLALRREAGVRRLDRGVIEVAGAAAGSFLQGQLSQDVLALSDGSASWSWLLMPNGKAVARIRVIRVDSERYWLDLETAVLDAALTRLQRFLLRTECTLRVDPDISSWGVRGPLASLVASEFTGDPIYRVASTWQGIGAVDVVGRGVLAPRNARSVGFDAWNSVRIEAGAAEAPGEINDKVIPQELGALDDSVSFTKGCYVGQELVARIDSRGHVNRWLAGLVVADPVIPPLGADVVVDDHVVGELTSIGESLDLRAPVGLAWVRRSVAVDSTIELRWSTGAVRARVAERPLVGAA